MNFLKTFFAILFAHRVMSVIITIVIGAILFYMVSDLDFMDKVFEGTTVWLNKNMGAMSTWVIDAIGRIKGKF